MKERVILHAICTRCASHHFITELERDSGDGRKQFECYNCHQIHFTISIEKRIEL